MGVPDGWVVKANISGTWNSWMTWKSVQDLELMDSNPGWVELRVYTQPIVLYFWFKYNLGQKYWAPQVQPDRCSNSWPPDHDSTLHVTETPALTTWPSVTLLGKSYHCDKHVHDLDLSGDILLHNWMTFKQYHVNCSCFLYFFEARTQL